MTRQSQEPRLAERQEPMSPHNLDAEMSVLSGLLLLNGSAESIHGLGAAKALKPEDFYLEKHGVIFAAIAELVVQEKPADQVILSEHLAGKKQLEAVGGADYLAQLLDAVPTAANLAHHVKIVKDKSFERKLMAAAGKITEKGYSGEGLGELRDEAVALARLSAYSAALEPEPLRLELGREPEPPGKSLGWDTTDKRELYIHPHELTLIAGRPGHGKTTLILNLMLNWCGAHPDERLVFYSYEINPKGLIWHLYSILTGRLAGSAGGFSYYDARDYLTRGKDARPKGWPDKLELFGSAEEVLRQYTTDRKQLYCEYCPAWPVDRLEEHARKLAEKGPLGAVFVDYVQKVQAPEGTRYERNDLRLTAVVERLQYLSKELKCPVVVAAQLNRDTVRDTKIPAKPFDDQTVQKAIRARRPQLHHLRDSGGLEQEADLVLGLLNYRADYKENPDEGGAVCDDESATPSPLELIVLKRRHGQPGIICPLTLHGRTGRIDG